MDTSSVNKGESLFSWAEMLVSETGGHYIDTLNVSINFLGEAGDGRLLTITKMTGECSGIEYIFLANNEDMDSIKSRLIFSFLAEMNFSATKIMDWLENIQFDDEDMGLCYRMDQLCIWKEFPEMESNAELMEIK